MNLKQAAKHVARQLVEAGCLVHRYDAYSTNSVYLKVDAGVACSIRLSDHRGYPHLRYRFNYMSNQAGSEVEKKIDNGYERFYYQSDAADRLVHDVLELRHARMAQWADYDTRVQKSMEDGKQQRGFWQKAQQLARKKNRNQSPPPSVPADIANDQQMEVCTMNALTITLEASPALLAVLQAIAGLAVQNPNGPAQPGAVQQPMAAAPPQPPAQPPQAAVPVAPPASPAPVQMAAAAPAPVPVAPQPGMQQAPPPVAAAPAPVPTAPTAEPTYTIDQISQAAALFAEAGDQNRAQVLALMQKYNAPMVTQLAPEYYNSFVVELRQLGAKI